MYENKDPGRLLLLRVRFACVPSESRLQLREYGTANDRGHQVHKTIYFLLTRPTPRFDFAL